MKKDLFARFFFFFEMYVYAYVYAYQEIGAGSTHLLQMCVFE